MSTQVLAQRDAEWIGPVYQKLGLSVACLFQKMEDAARGEAYRKDVTYGTAAEFGFDRVEEIPVRLEYGFTGSGINVEAIKRMVIDTMAIAYRIHLRHWYVRRFASLQRERMDAQLPVADVVEDRAPAAVA